MCRIKISAILILVLMKADLGERQHRALHCLICVIINGLLLFCTNTDIHSSGLQTH